MTQRKGQVVHLDDVPMIPTAETVPRVRIAQADRGGWTSTIGRRDRLARPGPIR
jgi:hypothetical protein